MRYISLEELAARTERVSRETEREFSLLTPGQLNAKLSPDSWSIAQCLDHLIVTNTRYFPQIEQVISGTKKKTFFESLPLLPSLWGKMLIKTVSPESRRRAKTFKVFYPSQSDLPGSIVKDFTLHNNSLIELMDKTYGLDLDRIIITSPVSSAVVYSLKDTFMILTLHEERHLFQAKIVKESLEL